LKKEVGHGDKQQSQTLSTKAIVILLALAVAVYFLTRVLNIELWQIVFSWVLLGALVQLGLGIIVMVFCASVFSAWSRGVGATRKENSKCRICGREFEPPAGARLHEIHMRLVHSDFTKVERPVAYLLSFFTMIALGEVLGWTYGLFYRADFSLLNIYLELLKHVPGLGWLGVLQVSYLWPLRLLTFMAVAVLGLCYYQIVRLYRGSYSEHPPGKKEEAYESIERTALKLSEQRADKNKQDNAKSG